MSPHILAHLSAPVCAYFCAGLCGSAHLLNRRQSPALPVHRLQSLHLHGYDTCWSDAEVSYHMWPHPRTCGAGTGEHMYVHTSPQTLERIYKFFRPCVSRANQLSEAGASAAAAENTRTGTRTPGLLCIQLMELGQLRGVREHGKRWRVPGIMLCRLLMCSWVTPLSVHTLSMKRATNLTTELATSLLSDSSNPLSVSKLSATLPAMLRKRGHKGGG